MTTTAAAATTRTMTTTDDLRGRDGEPAERHSAARINVSGCTTFGRRRRLFSFDGTRKLDTNETSRAAATAAAAAPSHGSGERQAGRGSVLRLS